MSLIRQLDWSTTPYKKNWKHKTCWKDI